MSPQSDCASSSQLVSEVFFCARLKKVNKLQLKWVFAAMHHGPKCWYKMTNCHQWGRHVPTLRNPTPSGFSLTAKNTSRIWTSIWYHPRCLHSHDSASQKNKHKTSSPLIQSHTEASCCLSFSLNKREQLCRQAEKSLRNFFWQLDSVWDKACGCSRL